MKLFINALLLLIIKVRLELIIDADILELDGDTETEGLFAKFGHVE